MTPVALPAPVGVGEHFRQDIVLATGETVSSDISVIAGSLSTLIFAMSTMPMILKAMRTRDLSSYSGGNLILSNAGNVIYAIYIFDLPVGPVWALYGFNLSVSMVMLGLWLRYTARRRRTPASGTGSYRNTSRHGSEKSSRLEVA